MFEDFYQTVLEWLQQRDHLDTIRSLSLSDRVHRERNPDRFQLWDSRIRLLIPANKIPFLFYHPYLLEAAVRKFANLGQYAGKNTVVSLVEQYLTCLINEADINQIERSIFQFSEQVVFWEDGSWHRQIQENRFQAVELLTHKAGFCSDWQSAAFLSGCGYLIPSSLRALQEWLRFSSGKLLNNVWRDWLEILQSRTSSPLQIYETDFTLNSFFRMRFTPDMKPFGETSSSCFKCPLNQKCRYFQTTVTHNQNISIENMIRIGDTSDIQYSALVQFIAGDRFTGSDTQKSLIEDYSDPDAYVATQFEVESADDKFLLFLKALKLFTERHFFKKRTLHGTIFNKSDLIYSEIRSELENLVQEVFYTLILDNRYRKILFKQITRGTLNRSLIHPREVFAPAIQLRAAAVVLVHNHPSGDPHPSSHDIEITKRLAEVGNIIGINVIDHVIIGRNSYFSFVDEDLM